MKDPDVFNGSEPQKLWTFLTSLSFVFLDHPNYFTDNKKINYTLSYLSGSIRKWFELDILNLDLINLPIWTYSYPALVKELQDHFSLYNVMGYAEDCISVLKMKDNEQI